MPLYAWTCSPPASSAVQCACTAPRRVADWFAQLNHKMNGDLKKIRVVGEYMIEVWKAAGMDLSKVEFLWASDEINAAPAEYWSLVMDVAMKFNLSRVSRCTQIMGRGEGEELAASQIFYPCMQCADIFFLKVRPAPAALPAGGCWATQSMTCAPEPGAGHHAATRNLHVVRHGAPGPFLAWPRNVRPLQLAAASCSWRHLA